jgi:hypothetical protein
MPRQATSLAALRRGEKCLYLQCVHLRYALEPTPGFLCSSMQVACSTLAGISPEVHHNGLVELFE